MSNEQHPALKNFSPMWETVKIIGSKALKWAAVGAVALGGIAMIPGAVAGLGGLVTGLFGFGSGTAATTAVVAPALQYGAVVGGLFGAVKGLGNVSEELEARKQDAIADYEQAQVSRERAGLMKQRGQSAGGSNLSPSSGYGRGQQQGVGM